MKLISLSARMSGKYTCSIKLAAMKLLQGQEVFIAMSHPGPERIIKIREDLQKETGLTLVYKKRYVQATLGEIWGIMVYENDRAEKPILSHTKFIKPKMKFTGYTIKVFNAVPVKPPKDFHKLNGLF